MSDILQEIERLRLEQIQLRMDLEDVRGDSDDYWQQALQHMPPVRRICSVSSDNPYKRFRLDPKDTYVLCNAGTYTCQGNIVIDKTDKQITGEGNDIDGYSGPFAFNTKYYVFLRKYRSDEPANAKDITVAPTNIKIVCKTSKDTDDSFRQKFWQIGNFTTNGEGKIPNQSQIEQNWTGDIDEITTVPDSNVVSGAVNLKLAETLEYNSATGLLQAVNAELQALSDSSDWKPTGYTDKYGLFGLTKDADYKGRAAWYALDGNSDGLQKSVEMVGSRIQIYKMDKDSEAASTGMDFFLRTAKEGAGFWVDVADAAEALQDHLDYEGLAGDIEPYLHFPAFKHTDADFTGYGGYLGTGKSGGNTDHDDSYWHAYNDGSGVTGHSAFKDDHSYRTTGTLWTSELHLSADGSADSQYWTDTYILANVIGAINMTAQTQAINLTAYSRSTFTFGGVDGGLDIVPAVDGVHTLNLGTLSKKLGDIGVNGKNAQTVTNWFEKGIMVGTLTEITVGDGLLPTDKILVLR